MKKLEHVPAQSEEYVERVAHLVIALEQAAQALGSFIVWAENQRRDENTVEKQQLMN